MSSLGFACPLRLLVTSIEIRRQAEQRTTRMRHGFPHIHVDAFYDRGGTNIIWSRRTILWPKSPVRKHRNMLGYTYLMYMRVCLIFKGFQRRSTVPRFWSPVSQELYFLNNVSYLYCISHHAVQFRLPLCIRHGLLRHIIRVSGMNSADRMKRDLLRRVDRTKRADRTNLAIRIKLC